MALSRSRRIRSGPDYWPGFVDALSTMLLSFVFLITVFMTAQFFLSRDVTGKDAAASIERPERGLAAELATHCCCWGHATRAPLRGRRGWSG